MKEWKNNIRVVEPYVPGEQPKVSNIIKLNTNENPYPPAPAVVEAAANMDANPLRLYPDPKIEKLVNALAKSHNVEPSQVFAGVGSDDVLSMIFLTFFNSKKPILFPDITYSFYKVWADVYRIPFETPALDENFRIVASDYYKENGGVVITNPNAPTSICEGLDFIRDILLHNSDSIVVVDEAYIDFGGETALPLLKEFDNLIIVRTFSKSRSMAGLRVGYAVASTEIIKALNDVKYSINSYTLNMPAIELATLAVESEAYYDEITAKIIATREWTIKELGALGFECLPSSANFVFAKHNTIPAETIFNALKAEGIFVRYFKAPRINEYLRITIGTDEEMGKVVEFLKNYFMKN